MFSELQKRTMKESKEKGEWSEGKNRRLDLRMKIGKSPPARKKSGGTGNEG